MRSVNTAAPQSSLLGYFLKIGIENVSTDVAFQRGELGWNKARLYYEDLGDIPRVLFPHTAQIQDEEGDGKRMAPIYSFHSFHLTFGRSHQTSLPSALDSMRLFCLQDSRVRTKPEFKTSVSLCYLQQRAAFCLGDQSSENALAVGLDLPGSVAGWMRGTDLTRTDTTRTLAASTQAGLWTKTTHPGIEQRNSGDSAEWERWISNKMTESRMAEAMQCKSGSISGI